MKTIKVITFPVRFILFLVTAIISGVILLIDQTVCLLCAFAAYVVRVIGLLIMLPAAAMNTVMIFVNYDSFTDGEGMSIMEWIVFLALEWLVVLFFAFLPKIAEKIYIWLYIGGIWLWNFSKIILFFRKYSRAEQEDIEVVEYDEQGTVFVEEEKKYSLSELREMAKVIGQLNQVSNNSVTPVNSDIQETAQEIKIDDIEMW